MLHDASGDPSTLAGSFTAVPVLFKKTISGLLDCRDSGTAHCPFDLSSTALRSSAPSVAVAACREPAHNCNEESVSAQQKDFLNRRLLCVGKTFPWPKQRDDT